MAGPAIKKYGEKSARSRKSRNGAFSTDDLDEKWAFIKK